MCFANTEAVVKAIMHVFGLFKVFFFCRKIQNLTHTVTSTEKISKFLKLHNENEKKPKKKK